MALATTRTYQLIFGKAVDYSKVGKVDINKYIEANKNDVSYLVEDLNIQFRIRKDSSKDPNKAEITIYNLSDDLVGYLDSAQDQSLSVLFSAGLDGDNRTLFSGTCEFVEDKWNGPERQTRLIMGDGVISLTTQMSPRSYRAGVKLNTILDDLIQDMNLPKGRVVRFADDEVLNHPMAFNGLVSNNLANLARNTGRKFSVQDGAVFWTVEGARFEDIAYIISEETGMRESPTPKNPNIAKRRLAKWNAHKHKKPHVKSFREIKEDAGLVVKTELNGGLVPESTVYLQSRTYTGYYKVVYVVHSGMYEGGDWVSEVGLSEVKGKVIKRFET